MKKVEIFFCLLLLIIFSSCGYSESDINAAREEGYKAGYGVGYKDGYDDGYDSLKPVDEPESGTILSGEEYEDSQITVTASTSSSYVISLKNVFGEEKVTFYVRAGDTVTVGAPAEYLYVYFASGTDWYGYGKGLMFGDNTVYSKDNEMLDFTQYTWEYTLTPVYDGNFSETSSDEKEFFD
ncbi:MAG: hypothetical protein ACI4IW_06825 [Oscillospiraceae bacterium]